MVGVMWSVQLHAADRPVTGTPPDAADLPLH